MRIFISNDDGIDSVGLLALVEAFHEGNEIYVVAPATQQSGAGHSFTFMRPLTVEKRDIPHVKAAYAVDGTPADCVFLGLNKLVEGPIDLLISGINKGPNQSSDCITSGTVGAAMEGMNARIPSIAISLCKDDGFGYSYPAKVCKELAKEYLKDPDNYKYVLNINVPFGDQSKVKGIKGTNFDGLIVYHVEYEVTNFEGKEIYRMMPYASVEEIDFKGTLENDRTATKNGYITVTPLTFDMVAHSHMDKMKAYESIEL